MAAGRSPASQVCSFLPNFFQLKAQRIRQTFQAGTWTLAAAPEKSQVRPSRCCRIQAGAALMLCCMLKHISGRIVFVALKNNHTVARLGCMPCSGKMPGWQAWQTAMRKTSFWVAFFYWPREPTKPGTC